MIGFDSIIGGVIKIADKFIADPVKKQEFELQLATLKQQSELAILNAETQITTAQIETNKTEASSENIFIAGWRPFIGWVCGIAFGYHFILQPLLAFVFSTFNHKVDLPIFNMDALNTVLFGILGLGTMRSYEKMKTGK